MLALVGEVAPARYRRTIIRETVLAFLVLVVFGLAGDQRLGYLQIEQDSPAVTGGAILFLSSLKMVFRSGSEMFEIQS